jgi:Cu-Zn family superoxide dismutase
VRHVGDLGNVESDKYGVATISLLDDLISLNGFRSIIGYFLVMLHMSTAIAETGL